MNNQEKSVRELQSADIDFILNYWHSSDSSYLLGMGVDIKKLPTRETLAQALYEQLNSPMEQKKSYCIIWELDNKPIGHSNTSPIRFGADAYMHLHLWDPKERKKGLGTAFVKMALTYFFENLRLKKLYCQPYALNPAPNKTLEKIGFDFIKEYTTIPGPLNFEQPVKRWELTREKFEKM